VIKDVEGLISSLQLGTLPLRNAEILHQSEIRIEEMEIVDLIAVLVAESRHTCCGITGEVNCVAVMQAVVGW